jgi:hypothetical protein
MEPKFFGGLTAKAIADVLWVSPDTDARLKMTIAG